MGAILFGHLGDRFGRKKALLWSLISMALPTAFIGLLPVYDQVGVLAPSLLLICRMVQGISIGGEFSGSVIFLAEHAPAHRKSYFSSWPDMGSLVGMIAASLLILLLSTVLDRSEMLLWGWRVPFVMSFVLAIAGYRAREALIETPEFLLQKEDISKNSWPLIAVVNDFKRTVMLATTFLMVNSGGYYILVVFLPNQNLSHYPSSFLYLTTTLNLMVMLPSMILGAVLADKIGQVPCLKIGYAGCLILALPLFLSVKAGNFSEHLFWQGLFAICLAFTFGPRSSFLAELFPPSIRLTGVAVSYNLGNAIFGGLAPLICAFLIERTASIEAPAYYIIVSSCVSFLSMIFLARSKPQAQKSDKFN